MKLRAFQPVWALTAASVLTAGEAAAHHPAGGMTPATLWHGVLSGIGHPILGLDHFAFVVGIGLLAGIAGLGLRLPALFAGAMAAGLAMHVAGVDVPRVEMLVAVSVVLIGFAVWRRSAGGGGWRECSAFAVAGLLHGYALAETVIGAEPTPLAGYIVGLIATQMAIAGFAWQLARSDRNSLVRYRDPRLVRFAGWAIVAVGAVHVVMATGALG
jgi:urease accessory protein